VTLVSLFNQIGGDAGQAQDVPLFGEDAHQLVVHEQAASIIFSVLSSPCFFDDVRHGPPSARKTENVPGVFSVALPVTLHHRDFQVSNNP